MGNERKIFDPNTLAEYQDKRRLSAWLAARTDWNLYRRPVDSSDPRITRLDQLFIQLVELLPKGSKVVDLGFGPEGRDIAFINTVIGREKKIQAFGIELVSKNIHSTITTQQAKGGTVSVEGKLVQADMVQAIPFANNSFDGAILSSVIQHITPEDFYTKVVPEISRILKPGGLLLMTFKASEGKTEIKEFEDQLMNKITRNLYFYNPDEAIEKLSSAGFNLYQGDESHFGGKITWKDQVRLLPMAAGFFVFNP